MLHTEGVAGIAGVSRPLGVAGSLAKAGKLAVVANRQQHGAVSGGKVLIGRQAGVAVAHALRHGAGVQKAGRLVGQDGHAHIQQRHVDVLALAGAVPHLDGGQNGAAGVHAGEQVGQRHAHPQRAAAGRLVGTPGDAHHAAHGLDHQVVAGARGVGTVLSKAGDRAVNQARVQRLQAGVVQPVLRQSADLEVFHQHIALQRHLTDQCLALRLRHVNRH